MPTKGSATVTPKIRKKIRDARAAMGNFGGDVLRYRPPASGAGNVGIGRHRLTLERDCLWAYTGAAHSPRDHLGCVGCAHWHTCCDPRGARLRRERSAVCGG